MHTRGIDDDGGFSIDRAFVLADATACALLFFHNGTFFLVTYNRLVGTLLITDEADLFRIPRNAPGLVDMGDSHLDESFFLEGKRPNGFGGADPPAKIAEFFAISDPGNQPGRIEPCQARF